MPLTVLVIDDVPFLVKTLCDFLNLHSQVTVAGTAGGGVEGLAKAEELRPDVITVDLSMPDLPGLKVIPRLRDLLPDSVIIALTSLEADEMRQAALDAGADAFVDKTQIVPRLMPAILEAARKHGKASVVEQQ